MVQRTNPLTLLILPQCDIRQSEKMILSVPNSSRRLPQPYYFITSRSLQYAAASLLLSALHCATAPSLNPAWRLATASKSDLRIASACTSGGKYNVLMHVAAVGKAC